MPLDRAQENITTQGTRIVSTTSLRSTAILTGSYVNSSSVAVDNGENQLVLLCQATMGSLTSMEIRVEFSDDDSTWFQQTFSLVSGGTNSLSLGEHQITADGNYRIPIPIADRYFRIGVKGTGTLTGSDLIIDGVLSTV